MNAEGEVLLAHYDTLKDKYTTLGRPIAAVLIRTVPLARYSDARSVRAAPFDTLRTS